MRSETSRMSAVVVCGVALSGAPGAAGGGVKTEDRVLYKEAVVSAPVAVLWKAWTTNDGLESFFCKKANVDLRVGGDYVLTMTLDAPEGQRGTEGCHILSYIPERMLSFEWNVPPSIPALRSANAHTHVVVEFTPLGGGVSEVRLTQLGWGKGKDWDKCYEYFDRAWTNVLQSLQQHVGKNPHPVQRHKVLRQQYVINAPIQEAWNVFTTRQGLEGSMVAHAEVDMRVGGYIKTHYDPDGRIGDANTITHHILSYEPGRMYSSRVEVPADTPVTRVVQDSWSVVYFDEIDPTSTRLTIASCGWGQGPDWDAAEAFFDKGNAWTINKINAYLSNRRSDATPEVPDTASPDTATP